MDSKYPSPQPSPARGEGVSTGSTTHAAGPRRGFTLTELLVVIAIIAMLVAITSVAVMRAMGTAKQTRVKVEVDQLDAAFKAYKEKYGDYPPCDWQGVQTNPILVQHIARAFPRYDQSQLLGDVKATGIDYVNFRPDQALVFWLRGFSNDPSHPFVTRDGYQVVNGAVQIDASMKPIVATRTSFYDFDTSRLAYVGAANSFGTSPALPSGMLPNTYPYFSYFPQGATPDGNGAPYLYWSSRDYTKFTTPQPTPMPAYRGFNGGPMGGTPMIYANAGVAVPYWLDTNQNKTAELPPTENWVNPDSFQILAAGGDGKYGAQAPQGILYRLYPTGLNYDVSPAAADEDNVTNFCAKARLGDARP